MTEHSMQTQQNQEKSFIVDLIKNIVQIPGSIMSTILDSSFDRQNRRAISRYQKIVDKIILKQAEFASFDHVDANISVGVDNQFSLKTNELKEMIINGHSEENILIQAFALAREAAKRTLGEEPYPVQLMGGIAIYEGNIAEMKTGEGKTLTAALPAYLASLYGKGVHRVTVNSYLAERDANILKPMFDLLGITTGYVVPNMSSRMRYEAYHADITYCTNNEIVFDYLKDNMVSNMNDVVHRVDDKGFHILNFAIVDEADSILIDEAKTPLIISGYPEFDHNLKDTDNSEDNKMNGYLIANEAVLCVKKAHSIQEPCYEVKKKEHQVFFTDRGLEVLENSLRQQNYIKSNENLYLSYHSDILHKINQSMKAHFLFIKDREYMVSDTNTDGSGRCQIIDEHTGRVLPGRRYSEGLHQAIEAKEGVEIKPESSTMASATFQNYFSSYNKLSGMTGTAITEVEEFDTTYNLNCIQIPPNRPSMRIDTDDKLYILKSAKKSAIIELVKNCYRRGQPVIIGTTNVEYSWEYGSALIQAFRNDKELRKINHTGPYPNIQILNATHHAKEAEIISLAGRLHAVTVVTNMAGRGTDIKLGGDPKFMLAGIENDYEKENILREIRNNKEEVIKAGGLMIVGVEHNNNRRIDNQLRGRAGRQGDPGSSTFFVSTEDDIIHSFNPNMTSILLGLGNDVTEVVEHPWLTSTIVDAQKRLEAHSFEQRQSLQKYANIQEEYIKMFYEYRIHILHKRIDTAAKLMMKNISNPEIDRLVETFNEYQSDHQINSKSELITEIKKAIFINPYINQHMLKTIDKSIRDFNDDVDHIKDMVSLQNYVQKDPLIAYYEQCKNLFSRIQYEMISELIHTIKYEEAISEDNDRQTESNIDFQSLNPLLKQIQDRIKDIDRSIRPDKRDMQQEDVAHDSNEEKEKNNLKNQ